MYRSSSCQIALSARCLGLQRISATHRRRNSQVDRTKKEQNMKIKKIEQKTDTSPVVKSLLFTSDTVTVPKADVTLKVVEQKGGPTCGIYALASVLRVFGKQVVATKADLPCFPNFDPTGPTLDSFFSKDERENGIFNPKRLVEIGKKVLGTDKQFDYGILSKDLSPAKQELKKLIDDDKLIIFPFFVDNFGKVLIESGNPKDGHWGIIFGYSGEEASMRFHMTHWGKVFSYKAEKLIPSHINCRNTVLVSNKFAPEAIESHRKDIEAKLGGSYISVDIQRA